MQSHQTIEKKLKLSIVLNGVITIVEVIGGLLSGSISLISDALHNLTDTFSLIVSLIATKLAKQQHTETKTFGYKRAEVLTALLNAAILIIVSFFIFKEAVIRFFHPVVIKSGLMISIAFIGLCANTLSAVLLKAHSHNNINIKSAYLHLFSDAVSSLAVIIGGICIYFLKIQWIDPLLTILIGTYVLKEGYEIVMRALHILMQHTPKDLNLKMIKTDVEQIQGVKNIHHVHAWCVTEEDIHFEAHIDVDGDMTVKSSCGLNDKIKAILRNKHAINHTTLQFECDSCNDVSLIY